jgi:hypothetical protein
MSNFIILTNPDLTEKREREREGDIAKTHKKPVSKYSWLHENVSPSHEELIVILYGCFAFIF